MLLRRSAENRFQRRNKIAKPSAISKKKSNKRAMSSRRSVASIRIEWRPSAALAAALNASTAKEYVLPQKDRTMFPKCDYMTENEFQNHGTSINPILRNLLALERRQCCKPNDDYFKCIQTEVTKEMRTMLVRWMREVCDEEKCSCEVFPLAVSYLDRFLSVEAVHKHQLQSLGCTCILLASKVKEPQPFSTSRLVQYTDDAVSLSELLSWELLVLNRLDWDLATLTAYDFLDQLLHQWDVPVETMNRIRYRLNEVVADCYTDFNLAIQSSSDIVKHICTNSLDLIVNNQQSQLA